MSSVERKAKRLRTRESLRNSRRPAEWTLHQMDVVCLACRPEELHRLSHGWQCHLEREHVVQIQPQENVSTQDTGEWLC